MSGSILLSDIAAQATILRVACSRCERAGQYPLTGLVARYGAHCSVPELLRRLSADCPQRQAESLYSHCGVNCPDLPALFRKGD